ncbi:MAG: hypothetical protein HY543_01120 [Deltaproteobacteria bacterium]|nr:hypothetical protein [Deltaproteobacteria bacterium]
MPMSDSVLIERVTNRIRFGERPSCQASGGVRFDTVRGIAETGVDFISSSKMIQSAPAVDIGLDEA